jgi:hypothetical protein
MSEKEDPMWLVVKRGLRGLEYSKVRSSYKPNAPFLVTAVMLGEVGRGLTLDELAYRHQQGIDFELKLRWKPSAIAPAGIEGLA